MTEMNQQGEQLLSFLRERAKELACLYKVEEVLENPDSPLDVVFAGVVDVIPPGWQYPDVCCARIVYKNLTIESPGFRASPWSQREDIRVQGEPVGSVTVYYSEERPPASEGPFLAEERRLIKTICDRLGHFILHQDLRGAFQQCVSNQDRREPEWRVAANLLRKTDLRMYETIARRLLHHLCWLGVKDARLMMESGTAVGEAARLNGYGEQNAPSALQIGEPTHLPEEIFAIGEKHVTDGELMALIQNWLHEDKSSFLLKALNDERSSLPEIADAMARYQRLLPEGLTLTKSATKNVVVALIRRFFTGRLDFIGLAKTVLTPEDFFPLLERVVYTSGGQGKLGGKSAGLFLAFQILHRCAQEDPTIGDIRIPKTWHLASDGLLEFIRHNNLEEVLDQKYKDIEQIRQEYDYIVRLFKGSRFTPEIVKGLSVALDDFGDTPLIVRSSSLLEDGDGTSFPGKYKSLFLANIGTKQERLEALLDAISEVYASTFGPDPLEYRAARGLIDFNEQMGVMIQEVVGRRVGKYFLPICAGVAFSKNEFRWSPRIGRDDGVVRLVPGLGTRAVDRLQDDYPVLVSPAKPDTRVNSSPEEIARYSPRMVDLINLESGRFETLPLRDFLRENATHLPKLKWLVSILEDGDLREPVGAPFTLTHKELVVTFDGLLRRSPFSAQIKQVLEVLQNRFQGPVDIEFAWDGENIYLLQCRPQSSSADSAPSPIPTDIAPERVLFTANRYVSDCRVPDLSHIVFVDPDAYAQLNDRATLEDVGRAVGRLNRILPKRGFALMGPGRWGSRGDIKLGVNVSYSDINNTALLVEIARQQGSYVPELSFGTHFFQDLVESSIGYLPLYPDDDDSEPRTDLETPRRHEGRETQPAAAVSRTVAGDGGLRSVLNWFFLRSRKNLLAVLVPEYAHLEHVVRVIDVPGESDGRILRVLTNGELDRAMGLLASPSTSLATSVALQEPIAAEQPEHWQWRLRMAERLAADMDMEAFGVKAIYVFGSTKNASAAAGSDIDLLLHVEEDVYEDAGLRAWLDGWSCCLAELNYMRTGYHVASLLDGHFVTDEDISRKTSFAVKIDAATDPARLLRRR